MGANERDGVMDKELAERIVDAASARGVEADLYEDYSGKSMYGRTTTGVVCESVEAVLAACLSEATAFVSPKWVPQMADSSDVMAGINRNPNVRYSASTPNLQGFEKALDAKVDEVAVFASASETFSQKNINCSIAESIERFVTLM